MAHGRWIGLVVAVVGLAAASARGDEPSAVTIATGKRATALVEIDAGRVIGYGSAFCIDAGVGLFVTNHHVVALSTDVADVRRRPPVRLVVNPGQPTQRVVTAAVVKDDEREDLAILKVTPPGDLTALPLGDPSALVETSPLTVFGFPLGGQLAVAAGTYPTVSVNLGRVTAFRRDGQQVDLIQLDAAVTHGNSGGPVVDGRGQVVGVLEAGVDGVAINFAISSDRVTRLLRHSDVTLTPNVLPPERPGEVRPTDPTTGPTTGPAATRPAVVRVPVPPAAALAAADRTIHDVYAAEFKDASVAGRRALAGKLATVSAETVGDPAGRYAAGRLAADLAADVADVQRAVDAERALSAVFADDGLGLEAAALKRASARARGTDAMALLASYGVGVVQQMVDAERYADAAALAPSVKAWGAASGSPVVRGRSAEWATFAVRLAADRLALKPSLDLLVAHPDDPSANLAVGKFYCLDRGDWPKGLPLMARGPKSGDDAAWRTAAAADLAAVGATDPTQLAQAGANWWTVGQRWGDRPTDRAGDKQAVAAARARLTERAAVWYRLAVPKLTGLARVVAERRSATPAADAAASTATASKNVPPRSPVSPPPAAGAAHAVRLTNRTNAAEGQHVIDTVAAQPGQPLAGVGQAELLRAFDATEFTFGGGVKAEKVAGGYAPRAAVGKDAQFLTYGAYEKRPAGDYLVVFRIAPAVALTGTNVCFCEACVGGGTIAETRPNGEQLGPGQWCLVPVRMKLDEGKLVEYRFWPHGHAFALDRVYVYRLGR